MKPKNIKQLKEETSNFSYNTPPTPAVEEFLRECGALKEIEEYRERGNKLRHSDSNWWVEFGNSIRGLRDAARLGRIDVIDYLVFNTDLGFSISGGFRNSHPNDGGDSLLEVALKAGNITLLDYLLNHGERIDGGCLIQWKHNRKYYLDALEYAVCENKPKLVEYLTKRFGSSYPNRIPSVADAKSPKVARMLIDIGANINDTDIIHATIEGSIPMVKFFLSNGCDPDVGDPKDDNKTALMFASQFGLIEIVRLLLEAGADPNVRDKYNTTAVFYAASNGYLEITRLLIEAGANPTIECRRPSDSLYRTPLKQAEHYRHPQVAAYLRQVLAEHRW